MVMGHYHPLLVPHR
jgi:hypothetical protein